MRTVAKETVLKKNEKNVAYNIRNRSPLSILKDKLLDLKNRTQEERITRLKLIERDFEIIKKVFEEHVKLTFLKLNISVESIGAAKGESAENIIYNTSSNSNVVYGIKSNDDSNKDQPVKIGSDISGAENNLSIGAVPCGSNIEKLETNIHLTTATVKTGEMIINNNLNPGYVFNSGDKILSSSVFEKVERGNNGILYKNHIIGNSTVQTVNQINNVAHPYYNHSVYNSGKINQIKTDNQIIQETKRIFTDDVRIPTVNFNNQVTNIYGNQYNIPQKNTHLKVNNVDLNDNIAIQQPLNYTQNAMSSPSTLNQNHLNINYNAHNQSNMKNEINNDNNGFL